MLQKIIMVLVSVFTMIASSVAPASLLGKGDGADDPLARVDPGSTVLEKLYTKGHAAGAAFARISVLSVTVDGREVLEDAWGSGTVKELTFKVGVKKAEGGSLVMGDETVILRPLDTITIRDFRGRFEFRDVRTGEATLALDGTVKTTLVAKGDAVKKVRTQVLDPDRAPQASKDPIDLAYVVLETGERVKTVEWSAAGAGRLYTWSPDKQDAEGEAASVLAKWIKIDGKAVAQYTWGDGQAARIEFEPTERATLGALLNWSGTEHALRPGESVVLQGFVGTYLAFQSVGGGMKLRLDGYAEKMSIGAPEVPTGIGGNVPPIARIAFTPRTPSTQDYVQFSDVSEDSDGRVVFREWTWGDTNQSTIVATPKHRFAKPGHYTVTLKVTDNALASTTTTVDVVVLNTPPVSDWDFDPKDPQTFDLVRFTDKSWDPDDSLGPVSREWDFGDGSPRETGTVATHAYTRAANYTATLTVTDSHGAKNSLSKVIIVRNRFPTAAFNYTPSTPFSNVNVTFTDRSSDRDGRIACWQWSFGDGARSTVPNPVHRYTVPGTYAVNLTVCDDNGARSTAQAALTIENRLPRANFTFSPQTNVTTATDVQFTDLSVDDDGTIRSWRWNFGDGSQVDTRQHPRHRFFGSGTFNVCLTVRDNKNGEATTCRSVGVLNSPPFADFTYSPASPVTNETVSFTDRSSDPDRDALVNWTWSFGDGSPVTYERNPVHRYAHRGTYLVTLAVKDVRGNVGTAAKSLTVFNDRPTASFNYTPSDPTTSDDVTFTATARDSDGTIVSYKWNFGDGSPVETRGTPTIVHRFATARTFDVRLTVTDNDGGNVTVTRSVTVRPSTPIANFTWTPAVPQPGQPAYFTDTSRTFDASIVAYRWDFGDGATSTERNPAHAFANPRTYEVRFTITDSNGTEYSKRHSVRVNDPPRAAFSASAASVPVGGTVRFTDASTDSDGTVTAWAWDFGGGATSSSVGPHDRQFFAPGTYTVRLTVTDNDGATGSATRSVTVQNRAPAADFTFSPAFPPRGSPVQFTDASTDPDAPYDAVETWLWEFNDGTTGSTLQNPSHVFLGSAPGAEPSSGVKSVRLKVTDGQAESSITKRLRVVSDHDLVVRLCAKVPDGRLLDMSKPIVGFWVNLTRPSGWGPMIPRDKSDPSIVYDPQGCALVRIPANEWAEGDRVDAKAKVFGADSSDTWTHAPKDSDTTVNALFRLPLPLVPRVEVLNGTEDPILAEIMDLRVQGWRYAYPTYTNQMERVKVRGHVDWFDGVPAKNALVTVSMRYIALRAGQAIPDVDNPVIGFCPVADVRTTDDAGNFASDVWFEPHCFNLAGEQGVYLPGWYQVRAFADFEEASGSPPPIPKTSKSALFYEDPFGVVSGRIGYPAPP